MSCVCEEAEEATGERADILDEDACVAERADGETERGREEEENTVGDATGRIVYEEEAEEAKEAEVMGAPSSVSGGCCSSPASFSLCFSRIVSCMNCALLTPNMSGSCVKRYFVSARFFIYFSKAITSLATSRSPSPSSASPPICSVSSTPPLSLAVNTLSSLYVGGSEIDKDNALLPLILALPCLASCARFSEGRGTDFFSLLP